MKKLNTKKMASIQGGTGWGCAAAVAGSIGGAAAVALAIPTGGLSLIAAGMGLAAADFAMFDQC